MKDILKKLYNIESPEKNFTRNDLAIKRITELIAQSKNEQQATYLRRLLVNQQLYFGSVDSTIAFYEDILKELFDLGALRPPESDDHEEQNNELFDLINESRDRLITAYLLKGEQLNCFNNHGPNACILPLKEDAIHIDKTPSSNAIEILEIVLEEHPDNYDYLWLYNIAHMTIGSYPDGVKKEYFIDFNKYQADISFPNFNNIAQQKGLNTITYFGGSSTEDFNNDGFIDIFITSNPLNKNVQLFINNGDGTFTNGTESAELIGITGGVNCNHVDYNNDGFIDIYIMRGGWLNEGGNQPNSLLRNNGNGTFTDVTIAAKLFEYAPSHTASWSDINNDGYVDLFVGNEEWKAIDQSNKNDSPSKIYLNNGDETFNEVANKCNLKINKLVKSAVWGDYNNDILPDLFVSCYGSNNYLFKNLGNDKNGYPQFKDVSEEAGLISLVNSFSCLFADINNDGWDDIFVSGYAYEQTGLASEYLGLDPKNPPHLYLNNQDGTFKEVAKEFGLDRSFYTMGINFGDINNDGYIDLYLGTGMPSYQALYPNILLLNDAGKGFLDVTNSSGMGHLQKTHGISFADMDNDGDQDVYLNIGGFYVGDGFQNAFFENPGFKNDWISIQLEGVTINRSAIGAKIKVNVLDVNNNKRTIYRTVSTGGSYGASELTQNIGLGKVMKIETIEITWPITNEHQLITNVEKNQFIKIIEHEKGMSIANRHAFN
ncbi:MAG: CRTAC1 family protein [Chitinophagales bacterium]